MSATGRTVRGGRGSVVPPAEVDSYYDRQVIKTPVWTWEVPTYFFVGGAAGASAVLAAAARLAKRPSLARAARRAALGATLASPPLLVSDLGRPERFHHMLRTFKPTSPMSVGSWVLAVFGPAAAASGVLAEWGRMPRLQRLAETAAGALGPAMVTYTAVLVADTAVPVWHEARRELPMLFAGSATASAASLAALSLPPAEAAPARRLAVAAAATELAASARMEQQLGWLAEPYHQGTAGRLAKASKACTASGAAVMAATGRWRRGAVVGALLLLAGSLSQRWAVFQAGKASAKDPRYVVGLQRQRMQDADEVTPQARHG